MTVTKFKTTKDWPFVIEFERTNEVTNRTECLTLRTGNRPRSSLIANAHKVAALALKFSGLHSITQAAPGERQVPLPRTDERQAVPVAVPVAVPGVYSDGTNFRGWVRTSDDGKRVLFRTFITVDEKDLWEPVFVTSRTGDGWVAVLRDLTPEEPCRYDHNGNCQEHGWFGLEGDKCPVEKAKELLNGR